MRKTKNIVSLFAGVLLMCSMVVPLNANAAKKVKLNKSKIAIAVGKTKKLKVLNTKKKVVWKSSKKAVAKVNKSGVVTAVSQGKAVITAKVGKKSYTCKVVVKEKPRLSAKSATICVGGTANLKVGGTSKKVVWSSDDSAVATVTNKGVVTGVGIGSTVIVAKVGNKKLKCNITVQAAVTTETTDLSVVNAGVRDITYVSEQITCESSDTTIATVALVEEAFTATAVPKDSSSDTTADSTATVGVAAKIVVYGLKNGTVDITIKNNCNDEVVTFKAIVKKPEEYTAKQKLIDYILVNGTLDNSMLSGYGLEELGAKYLVKEDETKTTVSCVIYSPFDDQLGFVDIAGTVSSVTVWMVVPSTTDTNKFEVAIMSMSINAGELTDMSMWATTLEPATYTGSNLVFSDVLTESAVDDAAQTVANDTTKKCFANVGAMIETAVGVKMSELGIPAVDAVEQTK